MPSRSIHIDDIAIQSPCMVPWNSMAGDDVRRFCGQCRLHVHDVSEMTRDEVGALLRSNGGNHCLRVWRRPDGRIITKDCNRVRRAIRRRAQALRAAAASLLALFGLGGCGGSRSPDAPYEAEAQRSSSPRGCSRSPDTAPEAKGQRSASRPPPAENPPMPGATVLTGR